MPQLIFSSPLAQLTIEKASENRTVYIPAVLVKLHQKLQDAELTCLLQTKTLYYGLSINCEKTFHYKLYVGCLSYMNLVLWPSLESPLADSIQTSNGKVSRFDS